MQAPNVPKAQMYKILKEVVEDKTKGEGGENNVPSIAIWDLWQYLVVEPHVKLIISNIAVFRN